MVSVTGQVVMVSVTGSDGVSVPVSIIETWRFPALGFCFWLRFQLKRADIGRSAFADKPDILCSFRAFPLLTLNGHQQPLIKPPRQSVGLLHVGRVPIILEALHTVHVGRVPIILEVLHRLDIQPRGRALHHVELVAVSEDYSARSDFLGP